MPAAQCTAVDLDVESTSPSAVQSTEVVLQHASVLAEAGTLLISGQASEEGNPYSMLCSPASRLTGNRLSTGKH